MSFKPYTILKTDIGPMISESHTSVYDVLITQSEGEDFNTICVIHNRRPMQTQVALDYIEEHRAELETELPALLAKRAENGRYHPAIVAERTKRPVTMTRERKAFYELLGKHRKDSETNGTHHSK